MLSVGYTNDSSFDTLSSLFDYYAFLFIAYELDSYELFLGETYYSKAKDTICTKIITALLDLYCIRFSIGTKKRRRFLIYFAI